jgi:hypothetical protein
MNFPNNVTWTVGLAYDDYDEDNINEEKVSPKLGVQWNITDDIRFRGAAFRTVKPALVASRTIQPTQVAGFDQFFDDVNGTVADRYAVGLDARVTADIRVGAEASWREVGQPPTWRMDRQQPSIRAKKTIAPMPIGRPMTTGP